VQMVCIWIVLYGPDVACHTPMSGKKVHEISVIPHTGLRDGSDDRSGASAANSVKSKARPLGQIGFDNPFCTKEFER
jgi:hypothetical protein